MKSILFIHQSAELYGSDKTLLYLVTQIRAHGYNPIVVLPETGPLYDALQDEDIEIIIAPVVKISRKMFSIGNLLSLPFQAVKSVRTIKKQLQGREIQWVHSNTLAVLTGALFAKRYGIRHLWHVHEIIAHPRFISDLYPKIVDYFSDKVVFNSRATMNFMLEKRPKLAGKSSVVLNGFGRLDPMTPRHEIDGIRKILFRAEPTDLVIALVGRISRWKGQQLLLKAYHSLLEKQTDAKLVFVGSPPPNQDHFQTALEEKIAGYGLKDKVSIVPFRSDIWKIWDSIDIAVVPSTEPEPFGLVAIEAMLASKPVVGAKHGGLTEIIRDGETGFFFAPNDEADLAATLGKLVGDHNLRLQMGTKGRELAQSAFSLRRYVSDFEQLYR